MRPRTIRIIWLISFEYGMARLVFNVAGEGRVTLKGAGSKASEVKQCCLYEKKLFVDCVKRGPRCFWRVDVRY